MNNENSNATNNSCETPPAGSHVREVICAAEQELYRLLRQRAEIMKRIGTIKQTLTGLANLFGISLLSDELLTLLDRKPASRNPGFTRACRLVLLEAGTALSARQVCEEFQRRFPDLMQRHKDPLASVTTALSRLADYAEVRCFLNGNGRRVWQWIADRGDSTANAPLLSAAPQFEHRQEPSQQQCVRRFPAFITAVLRVPLPTRLQPG